MVKVDDPNKDIMYKFKMIGFLILSFFAMLYVMTPTRKVQYRKNDR
jgi:hypothetical protein